MTQEQLAQIFTTWDARYRANPEEYWNSVEHLLRNTPDTYGNSSAVYFIELQKELFGDVK